MSIDPAISMAMSIQSQKGVYALLLGSGVSRSADIKTGWEITLDLIRKIAAAKGESSLADPATWYQKTYKKVPDYSEILEQVALTPEDRNALIKNYIEPDPENGDKKHRAPTAAHHAIARLVAAGYIKVIVTTNFDPLIEQALVSANVPYQVIASDDAIQGMNPLQHSRPIIIKLHGDYQDTRTQNTVSELNDYHPEKNRLLDRVFTEYGLVICGWSGIWDTQLRSAIIRNTRYRYTTYWMAHGNIDGDKTKHIIATRQATVIPVEDADKAFAQLENQINAIDQQQLADPRSAKVVVALAKKYLASDEYQISLNDLVLDELKKTMQKTSTDIIPLIAPTPNKEIYLAHARKITAACATLAPLIATATQWGKKSHENIWLRCITALANRREQQIPNYTRDKYMFHAPAVIIAYSACIGGILKRDYTIFKSVFLDTNIDVENGEDEWPAITQLTADRALRREIFNVLFDNIKNQPGPLWLLQTLSELLRDIIPPDELIEDLYHQVEYIISLISAHQKEGANHGTFMHATFSVNGNKYVTKTKLELSQLGAKKKMHPLLFAGLFDGDPAALEKSLDEVNTLAMRRR